MTDDGQIKHLLEQARQFTARGQDTAAKKAYLDVLRCNPSHFAALNELGALAYGSGHRSAARTAYEQAVRFHPHNPMGHVNLGNLLCENGDLPAARAHFEAALASDATLAQAHQGLAHVLAELGEYAIAARHWQEGFAGHATVTQRYRGTTSPVPILLMVSAKGGNIPTQPFLDDKVFAITALYTEFYDPLQPLPPHVLVFNAIGDADLCAEGLTRADEVLKRTALPVINPPAQVRATSRAANARRLGRLPGVRAPQIRPMTRSSLLSAQGLIFPLLIRAPGFHTGRHFLRVEKPERLSSAIAALPGDELLLIEYLDARGPDGMVRKYRVMIIDGVLYPLHLAISTDWKVHYFTSNMGNDDPTYRREEQRFLEDAETVLGPQAMSSLAHIGQCLGLDYAGIDFGLDMNGSVLLFEANPTMVINQPGPEAIWDYRRPPIDRVLTAAKHMVLAKAPAPKSSSPAR